MSLHRTTLASLVVLVALLACAAIGAARAGADSFGTGDRVVTWFAPGDAHGGGVAITYGSETVVAGTASNGADNDFALAAYDRYGQLDSSFGIAGKVRTDLGGDEQATDVAVDRLRRIVVVGYAGYPFTPALDEAVVARYLPDGNLDPSFGEGGIARVGTGGAQAVALDPDGGILISGGTSRGPFDNPWRVARLTEGGQLDPGFGGGDGEVTGSLYAESNYAEDVAVDASGRVYFAACGQNSETEPVFAAGRLLRDGTVDQSYGVEGVVKVKFASSFACAHSVAIDFRGRALVAGNGNRRLLAARLREDGSLDRSFSGDGRVALRYPDSGARLGGIGVDAHNRLVLAASTQPDSGRHSPSARFLLARLRADGRRDLSFAQGGDVSFRFGGERTFNAQATSVALYAGSIFAAGSVLPRPPIIGGAHFALLRYDPREHSWPGRFRDSP
jgi:uncharacterized delta-60 repeat protein